MGLGILEMETSKSCQLLMNKAGFVVNINDEWLQKLAEALDIIYWRRLHSGILSYKITPIKGFKGIKNLKQKRASLKSDLL